MADLTGNGGKRHVGRRKRANRSPIRRTAVVATLGVVAGLTFGASAASAATLDVTLAGSGKGAVTSNPVGINCSNVAGAEQTACSYDFGFFFGTGTLTATPGPGSAFLSWSGDAGWGSQCTGATNPCTTGYLYSGALTAIATFAPAPDPPAVTTGAASDVEFPSATVEGSVNPNSDDFAIRDCRFEYGLTTEYGEKAACNPTGIGTGTSAVAVSASIGVLDPAKTYHYRLVASNGGGTSHGEDQTFTSAPAAADDCPNAAIRAQQGAFAQRLPDCGAYELVSPSFTGGQAATPLVGTADGNQANLNSAGGFADTESLNDSSIRYATTRTESGWRTTAIAPPAPLFPFMPSSALDWTRDNSRSLWVVNLRSDEGTKRYTPVVRDPDGTFHVAGLTQDEDQDTGALSYEPIATTEDLLTVAQQTRSRPALSDGTTDSRAATRKSLYLSTYRPDGTLAVRQVAYRGGATMFPDCAVSLGTSGGSVRNAISRDGSKVFFTGDCSDVEAQAEAQRVWAKVGDDDPIDISASQCPAECGSALPVTFRSASSDGSRVYFTTEQRLLPEDPDGNDGQSMDGRQYVDLYEYDFNATGGKLRLVTSGTGTDGAAVWSVMRISDDGAYVYFIARGARALAGENARGIAPQPGNLNLYVYHRAEGQASSTTTFVGAMGGFDDYTPGGQTSSTGRYLLFQTAANLTGEKLPGDTLRDLYRYDAQEDELLRAWTNDPAHNGASRVGRTEITVPSDAAGGIPAGGMQVGSGWYVGLQMSEDGSKVGITTAEPLSINDRNAATDAYLWQADTGRITLLTDGTSKPSNQFSGSAFSGMTPSGDSLFVQSATPLLKGHTSGQTAAYVIRRNGGFPDQALPPEPCVGDACQGAPVAPPTVPTVGSVGFSGPGNAPSTSVSVSKLKAVVGSVAKLKVRVPAAGRVSVTGSSVRKANKSAGRARVVTVRVTLSAKARRTLKKRKRLSVKVRVAFESRAGGSASKTVTVVFKPKANKKGGR